MSDQTAATIRPAPPPHDPPAWSDLTASLSTREAARALGVTERTIRRAIARGDLVAVKAGRAFRIPVAAIAGLRAGRAGQPSSTRPLLHLVDRAGDGDDHREATEWTMFTGPAVPLVRLPAPLTGFIGRDQQVAAVSDLLLQDDTRLVTLTGVGGVGKTRLAIRVAEAMVTHFADGVVFVPLASVQDPALVTTTIAQTVGLRESLARSPVDDLSAFLRTRRLLLVVDNFEHVTAAAPELVTLLSSCPKLTLLVTSRVPLRVSGERVSVVPPLRLPKPPGAGSPDPASLTGHGQVEAIRLFVDRARAARADFTLSADQAPTVAAICTRLDGLPLAIELAAARCTVLTPESMLARLDQRLPLLTDGPRDQPGRLRTMRDAIAWSYDLLPPAAQALFRRLSVFTGGISLEAAEAMARLPATAAGRVPPAANGHSPAARAGTNPLDLLASLVDGTLLQPVELANGDQRYLMLETVREFAFEQLADMREEDLARACHGAHFLALAEAAQPELAVTSSEAVLDRLDLEHANLRGALTWSIVADPGLALRLSSYLGPFWNKRGYWSEGREWLERALEAGPKHPSRERAIALGNAGALAGELRDTAAAKRMLTESSAIADALDDADIAARALRGLGIIASNDGEMAAVATLFTEALDRYRALGRQAAIARCLTDLGVVAVRGGEAARRSPTTRRRCPSRAALGMSGKSASCLATWATPTPNVRTWSGLKSPLRRRWPWRVNLGTRMAWPSRCTAWAMVSTCRGTRSRRSSATRS